MAFDIFQVDWITVDINIIIMLILLLIGVKIFKELYRWRFFFSETSTIRRRESFLDISNKFPLLSIKKCTLTKSNIYQQMESPKPAIIILRRHRKLLLLKALTEAFSSFGYTVINVRLKSLTSKRTEILPSKLEEELQQVFPAIIRFLSQNDNITNQLYHVINFNKDLVPYNLLLKSTDCESLILINPRLNAKNIKVFSTLIKKKNQDHRIFTVFSENLNPVFANKKISNIFLATEIFRNTKHAIIQKSKSTFKYHETILLSILIRYIENE